MNIDEERLKIFEKLSRSANEPPTLMQKVVGVVVTVVVIGLALMFSVLLFAVVVSVGVVAWAYLWWRTRELRKQMREQRGRHPSAGGRSGGVVIEGEVIREVESEDRRER